MKKEKKFGDIDSILVSEEFKNVGGNWIAIVDKKIVAKGSDAKKVYDIASNKYPNKEIFIGKFPENRVMLL